LVPQVLEFVRGDLGHEIRRVAVGVSSHGSNERLRLNFVKVREVRIENDLVAPNHMDAVLSVRLVWAIVPAKS
jgi:hypothetical protein